MFLKAQPIFPVDRSIALNTYAVFETKFCACEKAELHITASSFYRAVLNGKFLSFGPARTAAGYAREDVIALPGLYPDRENTLVIEVVGYCCKSLSTVKQPSFLLAEIRSGELVMAYTGRDFGAFLPPCKETKVERYSGQRHFSEVWDFSGGYTLTQSKYSADTAVLAACPKILHRVALYPRYENRNIGEALSGGRLRYDENREATREFFSFPIQSDWGCFDWDEIRYHPYIWVQKNEFLPEYRKKKLPVDLSAGTYVLLDFGRIETGFFRFSADVGEKCDLVIAFTEDRGDGEFAFTDMHTQNVLEYVLPVGKSGERMSFEPYVARYVAILVKEGSLRLEQFGIMTFENDVSGVSVPDLHDPELNVIYESALRTFAHNAVDLYSDCPSRERAGWLCDSYFTAKTEFALFGRTPVESAFLENYRLFSNPGYLPDGALPECYPSDYQGSFIPQWNLWYLIELEEYLNLRNPSADREAFRAGVEKMLGFFSSFENGDGLLERLPSWNFVEWSVANEWTQDVSYPTNMLYAGALERVSRIYKDENLLKKANAIRETVCAQSFNGKVFLDHAVRNGEGKLEVQPDCSEACQYYAVLFGGIDIDSEKYAVLRHLILEVFGPVRKEPVPDIAEVNAFIGAYLRVETLIKMEKYDLLRENIRGFFGDMGNQTGTLWEYRQRHGSRDHGFASYALVALRRAAGLPCGTP